MKRFLSYIIAILLFGVLGVGEALAQPLVQSRYVAFSNITETSATASWINGNGVGRLVVISTDDNWEPITSYAAVNYNATNGNFNSKVQLGASNDYVVGFKTGSSRTIALSNLPSGTQFYVRVYEYTGTHGAYLFCANSGANNPRSFSTLGTLAAPAWAVTATSVNQNTNTVVIDWVEVAGAVGYVFDIDDNNNFASPLAEYDGLDVGSLTVWEAYLPVAGTYYVRVRAYNNSGIVSPNNAFETITIDASMPPKFLDGDEPILSQQGTPNFGNFDVTLTFDQDLYSANNSTGDLATSDFALYNASTVDGNAWTKAATISAISHTAGSNIVTLTIQFNERVASTEKFRIGPADATSVYSVNALIPGATGIPMDVTLNGTKGGQYSADITCPNASVLNVTLNPDLAFTSIQNAIGAIATAVGHTIQLENGRTYPENVTNIGDNKELTLTDEGGIDHTNDAKITGRITIRGVATIQGIAIEAQAGQSAIGYESWFTGNSVVINHCVFTSVGSGSTGNYMISQTAPTTDGRFNNITITNNTFTLNENHSKAFQLASARWAGTFSLTGNTVALGTAGLGFYIETGNNVPAEPGASSNLVISGNGFTGTGTAVQFARNNATLRATTYANGITGTITLQENNFDHIGLAIDFLNTSNNLAEATPVINLGTGVTANTFGQNCTGVTNKFVYSGNTLSASEFLYPGIAVLKTDANGDLTSTVNAQEYNTVAAAIAASANDGSQTVYLGKGTYTEAIALNEAVDLVGKGASDQTILTNTLTVTGVATYATTVSNIAFDVRGAATNSIAIAASPANSTINLNDFSMDYNDGDVAIDFTAATVAGIVNIAPASGSNSFGKNYEQAAGASATAIRLANNQITGTVNIANNNFAFNSTDTKDIGIYVSTTNTTGVSDGTLNITGNNFQAADMPDFNGFGDAIVFVDAVDFGVNHTYDLESATINIFRNNVFDHDGYGVKILESTTCASPIHTTLPIFIDVWDDAALANKGNSTLFGDEIYGAAWFENLDNDIVGKLYPSLQAAETADLSANLRIGEGTYDEDVTFSGSANLTTISAYNSELAATYTATLEKNYTFDNSFGTFLASNVVVGDDDVAITEGNIDDAMDIIKTDGTISIAADAVIGGGTVDKRVTITDAGTGGTIDGTLTVTVSGGDISNLNFTTASPAIYVNLTNGCDGSTVIENNVFALTNGGDGILVQTGNANSVGTFPLNIVGNSFTGGDATSKAVHFRAETAGSATFSAVNVYNSNTFDTPGYNFYKTNDDNLCTYLPSVDVNGSTTNNYTTKRTFGFYYNPASVELSGTTENILTDCAAPAVFTTQEVLAYTGLDANTGTAVDYLNGANDAVKITVPLSSSDASLVNGNIQIIMQVNTNGFAPIGSPVTIDAGDVSAGHKTISISEDIIDGFANFAEGVNLYFSAIVTDFAGNPRTGTQSVDVLVVDQTVPATPVVTLNGGNYINNANKDAVALSFTHVAGDIATYNYTITDAGTAHTTSQTNQTITASPVELTGIDLSTFVDGTITASVTVRDLAGNLSVAGEDTEIKDVVAPDAPTNVVINGGVKINNANKAITTLGFDYAEAATYSYTYTTSGGAGTVVVTDAAAGGSPVSLSNINLTGLEDGVVTVSVIVKDVAGNPSTAVTDTEDKDVVAPTQPTVVINDGNYINASNYTSTSLEIAGEVGTTYAYVYTVDDTNPVTGSGTLDVSPKTLTVDLTHIVDGTASVSVTLTDAALNVSTAGTDTELKDVVAPLTQQAQAVTTIGGNVVAGYWNASNTSLTVVIPVADDPTLDDGTIELQASKDAFGTAGLVLGDAHPIVEGDRTATNYTFTITKAQFEALTGFAEGDVWSFRAKITDKAGNETVGIASATTLTVDRVAPTVTLTSATADNVINIAERNAGFSIFAQSNEATGTVYAWNTTARAGAAANAADLIANSFGTAPVTGANNNEEIGIGEANAGSNIHHNNIYNVYTIDAAGNISAPSTATFTADLVAPSLVHMVYAPNSVVQNGLKKIADMISTQFVFSEGIQVTGSPRVKTNAGAEAYFVHQGVWSASTSYMTYTVVEGDETAVNNFTLDAAAIELNGGTITDMAGNPASLTIPANFDDDYLTNTDITIDGVRPTFTVQYFLNAVTGINLGANPLLGIGSNYWIMITASEELDDNPTISIDGLDAVTNPNNNVTGAATFLHDALNNQYSYNRIIVETNDNRVQEMITITATDLAGNTSTNDVPTNAAPTVDPETNGNQARVDGFRPTPYITFPNADYLDVATQTSWTNDSPLAVTVDYAESMQNVTLAKVIPTNANLSNFVANHATGLYTFDATPTAATITIEMPEGALANQIKDGAGNYAYGHSATIKYDAAAPTTTDNVPATWQNANFNVTLTSDDGTGSGVAKIYYIMADGVAPADPTTASDFVTAAESWQIPINAEGEWHIKYFAEDNVGNLEAVKTAANVAKLDKSQPTIPAGTITAPELAEYWNDGNHTIEWEAGDINAAISNLATNPITLYYTLDHTAPDPTWVPIASGLSNSGSYVWNIPSGLNTTNAKIRLDAVDNAGNIGSVLSDGFNLDDIEPTISSVTITPNNSPTGGFKINATTNTLTVVTTFSEPMKTDVTPTFAFTPELEAALTFNNDDVWSVGNTVLTRSYTVADINLNATNYTLDITAAQDLATNVSTAYQVTGIKVDQVDPVITYRNVYNSAVINTNTTDKFVKLGERVYYEFTSSEEVTYTNPIALEFDAARNQGGENTFTPFVDGLNTVYGFYGNIDAGYADGAMTFEVGVRDLAGNASNTLNTVSDVIVDKTNPAFTITAPVAPFYTNGTQTVTLSAIVDNNLDVTEARIGAGAYAPFVNGAAISTLSGYNASNNGNITIDVRHTDKAGNYLVQSVTVTQDVVNPVVTINTPVADFPISATRAFTYTATDLNATPNTVKARLVGNVTGAWSINLALGTDLSVVFSSLDSWAGLTDGATFALELELTDLAGNVTTISRNYVKDVTAPTITNLSFECNNTTAYVTFSEPVYSTANASGNLSAIALTYNFTDPDLNVQVNGLLVSHTAGTGNATITLTLQKNPGTDIDGNETFEILANGTNRIYDRAGNNMLVNPQAGAMRITPAAPTADATQEFCASTAPTVAQLTTTSGLAIKWYDVPTGGVALNGATLLVNGTYYASQTVNGCESNLRAASIVTLLDPSAPTGDAVQNFCITNNPQVSNIVTSAPGAGYELVYKTNLNVVINNPAATALNNGDVIRIYRKHTATNCESVTFLTVTANVEAAAVAHTIAKQPNTASVCAGVQVRGVFSGATGGNGIDEYEYRVSNDNGATWGAGWLTLNTTNDGDIYGEYINTTGLTNVEIRTRRLGTHCASSAYTTATWTVNPLPTASIAYVGSPQCKDASIVNVNRTGQAGGTYTAAPAGLTIDANTGAINVGTSTPGTYTITYSFTDGTCANTTTTEYIIKPVPVLQNVTVATLCSETNINVTLEGSLVGTTYYLTRWDGMVTHQITSQAGTGNPIVFTVNNAAAGAYQVVADLNGCTMNMNGVVTVNQSIAMPNADNVTKTYDGAAAAALVATGAGDIFRWYNNPALGAPNLVYSGDSFSHGHVNAGTYTYYVTQQLIDGCESPARTVTVTINKANVSFALSNNTYNYNGTLRTATVTPTSTPALIPADYIVAGNTATNAGIYAVTVTLSNNNFNMTTPSALGNLVINKVGLLVAAVNKEKCFGQPNPALEIAYEGFVGGDDENDLTVMPTVIIDGTDIVFDVLAQSVNYDITHIEGTFTVNPLPIVSITPSNNTPSVATTVTYTTENGMNNYAWNISGGVLNTDYTIVSGGGVNDNTIQINWITAANYTVSVNYVVPMTGCTANSATQLAVSVTTGCSPVAIVLAPQNASICAGDNHTFTVTVSGTAPYTYEWYRVGVANPVGTNPTLVTNIAGNYYVKVFNVCGVTTHEASSQMAPATLTINAVPSITVATQPTAVCSPNTVNLNTATFNDANATLGTVYFYTDNLAQNAVANPASVAAGTYYARKQSNAGCWSNIVAVTATVNPLPSLTVTQQPTAVCSPNTVDLTTAVINDANAIAGTVHYYYDNLAQNEVTIVNAVAVPAGTYYARKMAAGTGCLSNIVTLTATVNSAPTVTLAPASASVNLNGNTSFSVTASNAVSYAWIVSTDGTNYSPVADGGVYSNATTSTLNITSVNAGMNGYKYKAVVTNTCGSTTSSEATLSVVAASPTSLHTINLSSPNPSTINVSIPTSGLDFGERRIVVIRRGSAPSVPQDGKMYLSNTIFGNGGFTDTDSSTVLKSFVVLDSTTSTVSISGLLSNTTYHVAVFGYNRVSENPLTYNYNNMISSGTNHKSVITKRKVAVDEQEPLFTDGFDVSRVTPNPVSNEIRVTVNTTEAGRFEFELYNSIGEVVYARSIDLISGPNAVNLMLTAPGQFAAGKYNLRIRSGMNYIDQQVVVMP